jgi:hypothetical protein
MREGSVVLFHDVHPSMVEHLRESYLACMYLRKLGYNIQLLKDTWWGLWRREDGRPEVGLAVRGFNGVDTLVLRARGQDPIQDALTFALAV